MPGTRNVDLAAVEARIGPRTRAILPTHFAGLPCDMDGLYALAAKHKLRVIEDAALAIGSSWRGKRIGSFGDICIFSFHPEQEHHVDRGRRAGAWATSAKRARSRCCASTASPTCPTARATSRWPAASSTCRTSMPRSACAQLAQLPGIQRQAARARPRATSSASAPIRRASCRIRATPATKRATAGTCSRRCFRLPQLTLSRREFRDALEQRGIGTGMSYEAAHLATLYRRFGYHRGSLPHTERIADTTVTLPLHPAMTDADVDRVCAACAEVLAAHRALTAAAHRAMAAPAAFRRHPGLQRGGRAPALFARLYPALDALACPVRSHLRQRRQPRPLGGAAQGPVPGAPGRDARRPVQRELRPAPGDHRRLRARARRARRHARRRPAESAGGNRAAAGRRWTPATTTWAACGARARTRGGGASRRAR